MSDFPIPKRQKVDLRLPYGLRGALNEYAAAQGRSTNEQIVLFIEQGMKEAQENKEWQARIEAKLDCLIGMVDKG